MIVLFSKFLTTFIVFFKLFFWIKFEILRIFFDLWLCVFVQRTRRQNNVVWIVNFSKIFLNFKFFFDDDFLFNVDEFQICFSIFLNSQWRSFSAFFNHRYDFWTFKTSKKLCAFWFFDHENRFLNDWLHAELNFFDKSLNIINVVEKRWNDENAQAKRQSFAVYFFSSSSFLTNVYSIFSVKIVKIDIWFDDWFRSRLISQCVMFACNRSIMKIKSMMLREFFAFHVTILWDRHKFICFVDEQID